MKRGWLYGALALGLGSVLLGSKSKAKPRSASSRIRFAASMTEVFNAFTSAAAKGCVVVTIMAPGVVSAWKAAAARLLKEYSMVTFIGTATAGAQADLQELGVTWKMGVWEKAGLADEPMYEVSGSDLDALTNELENATLHCTGAM